MSGRGDVPAMSTARLGLFEIYRRCRELAWVQVVGTSMRPTLAPGSWIQVQFGETAPRVGEIVVFRQDGTIVAHRVIRISRGQLLLKGDGSRAFDAPATVDDVLGVVRARRPREGQRTRTFGCHGVSGRLIAACSAFDGRVRGRWSALRAVRVEPRRPEE